MDPTGTSGGSALGASLFKAIGETKVLLKFEELDHLCHTYKNPSFATNKKKHANQAVIDIGRPSESK